MNNIKKYKQQIIIFILAVLLTLPILSNKTTASDWVGGVELENKTIADPTTTTGLAWFIANHTDLYMNAKIDEIYALNQKNNNTGLASAEVMGTHDIYYNTSMCLYHASGSNKDGYMVKMSNIIEFESPGIMTIYKWTGTAGSSKISYDSYKVDLSNEKVAKDFWVNKMKLPASTFNHEKMKTDILAFAYLDYKSTQSKQYDDRIGIYGIENSMYYLWGGFSNRKAIKDYVNATGKMDPVYKVNLDYSAPQEQEKDIAEAVKAVANSTVPLSLTKNDTAPTVDYQNGKAYIGPLKATFTGGTPKITVEGTEVKWTTKNKDGSYNKEENGKTLTSGQTFYAVVSEKNVKNNDSINVKVELTADKYRSRIILSTNKSAGGQSLMFHAGVKETDSIDTSWDVVQNKNVSIQKQDENGNPLQVAGIKFEIYDPKGEKVGTLETDKNGKTNAIELTANKKYTLKEIENNVYGYKNSSISGAKILNGGKIISSSNGEVKFSISDDTTIEIKNTLELGNLKLEKYDEVNKNIKLENVGFVIEISPAPSKSYAYLALYNKEGKIVPSIKEEATINKLNEANDNEYKVSYYCTDKEISKMNEDEKANITTFITNNKGTLTVKNLEVYEANQAKKYTYKLIETTNSNYGYAIDSAELGNITLETNKTITKDLANKQKNTKISGFVWVENPSGKSNQYDLVYTEGDSNNDEKLKDLYITENGKLIKNSNAKIPVEIILRDKTTGKTIKTLPDEFDGNGKYTFTDIEIDKISNYEVVFVYNGFYYTTVVNNLENNNGSKVKEIASERETLNSKFSTVKNNNEVVSTDGTVNTVEYNKQGHTSTVSKLNFDTTLSATTSAANYNLKEAFDKTKASSTTTMQELENVNMGIVLREQPKLSVNDDIYSVLVGFEGYQYNYEYNGRQNFYENKNGDDIGVKFEQENTQKRYTRTVFASDVQAAKDQNKEIKVAVTYKIQVANESRTLSIMPKQLINYFDARYDIKAVGLGFDKTTHTVTDELKFSEAKTVDGHPEYKSAIIEFNQTIAASNSNIKDLYITFDIQRDAILDLLNQKSTYHNAVEILSYTSLYGTETSKVDGKQFTTDQTENGKVYAGIDKMSQPGNMEIALVDHPSVDGTKILDTTNFEDDTSSAPSLLLEATSSREISGTIWEDMATNTSDNQKLGDGIYDAANEKAIQNVTVELRKLNEDGSVGEVATYSNGENVSTVTDENGNYTFGYYDEANKKYVGILPGKYVIAYTYNNSSYIVGGKSINPNEYKSTIITSQNITDAFNGKNQRWYVVEENRYSDARDDIYLRPEYNSNIDSNITVTNSTYNNVLSIDSMKAYTPIMDIGIEFTETDEANGMIEFHKKLNNIDFGIIERPNVNVTIDKKITGLEVIAQNGTNIIPKGNPSNPGETMQYVKTGLDGLVSAEIEPKLLQGAQLNLEYTITVSNNSNKDYFETDYYYYGKNGKTEITPKVKKVVDYLDSTIALDTTKNEAIWVEKTADDLYNSETKEGLITEEVYNELKSGNYHILVSEEFENVEAGSQKSITLYATKALASSDSINADNRVEIIELTGKRTVKESIPGDYNPTNVPNEQDSDKVKFQITQPTGTTVNYIVYIISVVAMFAILVSGIVIIKKKVVKK